MEAHAKFISDMRKGVVCHQEITHYIVCIISVFITYLARGCVYWKLFTNGNSRNTEGGLFH